MSKAIAVLLAMLPSAAWCAESTPVSNPGPQPGAQTEQQVLDQFKADLRSRSAEIIAKNLKLTAEEASKFWPLYEAYQKEQDKIIAGQLESTQQYAAELDHLDDTHALAYLNALLERDEKVHDLRVKWLAKFQTVIPAKQAARAIQLERRMGLVAQLRLSSQIPLIR